MLSPRRWHCCRRHCLLPWTSPRSPSRLWVPSPRRHVLTTRPYPRRNGSPRSTVSSLLAFGGCPRRRRWRGRRIERACPSSRRRQGRPTSSCAVAAGRYSALAVLSVAARLLWQAPRWRRGKGGMVVHRPARNGGPFSSSSRRRFPRRGDVRTRKMGDSLRLSGGEGASWENCTTAALSSSDAILRTKYQSLYICRVRQVSPSHPGTGGLPPKLGLRCRDVVRPGL